MAVLSFKLHELRIRVIEAEIMDHLRKQVRDGAKAALDALVPADLTTVNVGRVYPVTEAALLEALIWTGDEERLDDYPAPMGDTAEYRSLELVTELRAMVPTTATPNLLDTLDAGALVVEKAVQGSAVLAGLLMELEVASTATEITRERAQNPVGVMTITWRAVYRCNPADPSVLA